MTALIQHIPVILKQNVSMKLVILHAIVKMDIMVMVLVTRVVLMTTNVQLVLITVNHRRLVSTILVVSRVCANMDGSVLVTSVLIDLNATPERMTAMILSFVMRHLVVFDVHVRNWDFLIFFILYKIN